MVVIGVVLAAVVAFVEAWVYYSVVPTAGEEAADGERLQWWQVALELMRCLVVATLLAGLLGTADWEGTGQGALLGIALWALPVVLLSGSVLWERVPIRRAAMHLGDWLVKLVVVGAIVGAFI
ncbi:MAG: DUF1761 domain-containing protein [Dermatophilaceae bacterium]